MKAEIISIDDIKEDLPGYSPKKAEAFHSQSAKLADQLFDVRLRNSDLTKVILLCGGSASGKTEYLHTFLEGEPAIIYDGTLSSVKGVEVKLRNINRAKKEVDVHAVIPTDLKRAFAAFLNRDRQFSDEVFYRTHSGARQALSWIARAHPDVGIKVVESYYKIGSNEVFFDELIFNNRARQVEYLEGIQYTESQILGKVVDD